MNDKYLEAFKRELYNHGYDYCFMYGRKEHINGHDYWTIDIKGRGQRENKTIQAFILMRVSTMRKHFRDYKIWKTYHQTVEKYDIEVNPTVYIVSFEDNRWRIFKANGTKKELKIEEEVNYESACNIFERRLKNAHRDVIVIEICRWLSWLFSILLFAYLIAHIITEFIDNGQFPLTIQLLYFLIVAIVLSVFPIFIPQLYHITKGDKNSMKAIIKRLMHS